MTVVVRGPSDATWNYTYQISSTTEGASHYWRLPGTPVVLDRGPGPIRDPDTVGPARILHLVKGPHVGTG